MSKYYEQNHAHQGIGGDGSSQISYNSLTDLPDITAENVTYDNTTSGLTATNVQSAIDEVVDEYIPIGDLVDSEVTALSQFVTTTSTYYFKVESYKSGNDNILYSQVQFSITNSTSGSQTNLYLTSAVTGAETGSTSWAKVGDAFFTASEQKSSTILQPGYYALYVTVTGNTAISVKYKKRDTGIEY